MSSVLASVLGGSARSCLLEELLETGGFVTAKFLSERVGVSVVTVHACMKELCEQNVVVTKKGGVGRTKLFGINGRDWKVSVLKDVLVACKVRKGL